MSQVCIPTELPNLTPNQRSDIALLVIGETFSYGLDLTRPNNLRRDLINQARRINVEPNVLLAFYSTLLKPKLDELFKPILEKEVRDTEAENERKQKEREEKKKLEQKSKGIPLENH